MVGFGVKNTTIFNPLDLLCPHYCRGCGQIGEVVCECCKNYVKTISFYSASDLSPLFESVFAVGWYDGPVGSLIREYKYNSVRSIADVLVEFIDEMLPFFDVEITLVPLPTIALHIRQRGFDHIGVLTHKLAKKRGWSVERCLVRNKNSVQVGVNSGKRLEQAKDAYKIRKPLCGEKTYMLVDDVWTTGSSMNEAAKIMRKNGAKRLMSVVLCVNRGKDKRCAFGITSKGIKNKVNNSVS